MARKFPCLAKEARHGAPVRISRSCPSILDGQSRGGFLKAAPFLRSWGVGQLVLKFLVQRGCGYVLIAALLNPDADLLFNGETSGDGPGEAGLERKGVRFERHGEMKFRVGEAAHEEVDVTI